MHNLSALVLVYKQYKCLLKHVDCTRFQLKDSETRTCGCGTATLLRQEERARVFRLSLCV